MAGRSLGDSYGNIHRHPRLISPLLEILPNHPRRVVEERLLRFLTVHMHEHDVSAKVLAGPPAGNLRDERLNARLGVEPDRDAVVRPLGDKAELFSALAVDRDGLIIMGVVALPEEAETLARPAAS